MYDYILPILCIKHGPVAAHFFPQHLVIGLGRAKFRFVDDGIALRKIKNHHVITLHGSVPRQTLVWQLYPFEVAWYLAEGHQVVYKGKAEGCLGNTRSVGNLIHKQKIIYQQRFFHGWGRDGIGFKNKGTDERGSNNGKNTGINPFAAAGLLVVFENQVSGITLLFTETEVREINKGQENGGSMVQNTETSEMHNKYDRNPDGDKLPGYRDELKPEPEFF